MYYIAKPKWLFVKMTIGLSIKPCMLNAKFTVSTVKVDYYTVLYTINLPKTKHYKLILPKVQ